MDRGAPPDSIAPLVTAAFLAHNPAPKPPLEADVGRLGEDNMTSSRSILFAAAAALALAAATPSTAQIAAKSKGDPRVRTLLTELKLKYQEMPNGDFRLVMGVANDRTHMVIVESTTNRLGIFEIRDIWALGLKSQRMPDADVLARLLTDSARRKVGGWEIHEQEGGVCVAIFNVKSSADCDAEALKTLIEVVAQSADEVEKAILETDEL